MSSSNQDAPTIQSAYRPPVQDQVVTGSAPDNSKLVSSTPLFPKKSPSLLLSDELERKQNAPASKATRQKLEIPLVGVSNASPGISCTASDMPKLSATGNLRWHIERQATQFPMKEAQILHHDSKFFDLSLLPSSQNKAFDLTSPTDSSQKQPQYRFDGQMTVPEQKTAMKLCPRGAIGKTSIQNWFRALSIEQRVFAVSSIDLDFVNALRRMQNQITKDGEGVFKYEIRDLGESQEVDSFTGGTFEQGPLSNNTDHIWDFKYMSLADFTRKQLATSTIIMNKADNGEAIKENNRAMKSIEIVDFVRITDTLAEYDTFTVVEVLVEKPDRFFNMLQSVTSFKPFILALSIKYSFDHEAWLTELPPWFDLKKYNFLGAWVAFMLERNLWLQYQKHLFGYYLKPSDQKFFVAPQGQLINLRYEMASFWVEFQQNANQDKSLQKELEKELKERVEQDLSGKFGPLQLSLSSSKPWSQDLHEESVIFNILYKVQDAEKYIENLCLSDLKRVSNHYYNKMERKLAEILQEKMSKHKFTTKNKKKKAKAKERKLRTRLQEEEERIKREERRQQEQMELEALTVAKRINAASLETTNPTKPETSKKGSPILQPSASKKAAKSAKKNKKLQNESNSSITVTPTKKKGVPSKGMESTHLVQDIDSPRDLSNSQTAAITNDHEVSGFEENKSEDEDDLMEDHDFCSNEDLIRKGLETDIQTMVTVPRARQNILIKHIEEEEIKEELSLNDESKWRTDTKCPLKPRDDSEVQDSLSENDSVQAIANGTPENDDFIAKQKGGETRTERDVQEIVKLDIKPIDLTKRMIDERAGSAHVSSRMTALTQKEGADSVDQITNQCTASESTDDIVDHFNSSPNPKTPSISDRILILDGEQQTQTLENSKFGKLIGLNLQGKYLPVLNNTTYYLVEIKNQDVETKHPKSNYDETTKSPIHNTSDGYDSKHDSKSKNDFQETYKVSKAAPKSLDTDEWNEKALNDPHEDDSIGNLENNTDLLDDDAINHTNARKASLFMSPSVSSSKKLANEGKIKEVATPKVRQLDLSTDVTEQLPNLQRDTMSTVEVEKKTKSNKDANNSSVGGSQVNKRKKKKRNRNPNHGGQLPANSGPAFPKLSSKPVDSEKQSQQLNTFMRSMVGMGTTSEESQEDDYDSYGGHGHQRAANNYPQNNSKASDNWRRNLVIQRQEEQSNNIKFEDQSQTGFSKSKDLPTKNSLQHQFNDRNAKPSEQLVYVKKNPVLNSRDVVEKQAQTVHKADAPSKFDGFINDKEGDDYFVGYYRKKEPVKHQDAMGRELRKLSDSAKQTTVSHTPSSRFENFINDKDSSDSSHYQKSKKGKKLIGGSKKGKGQVGAEIWERGSAKITREGTFSSTNSNKQSKKTTKKQSPSRSNLNLNFRDEIQDQLTLKSYVSEDYQSTFDNQSFQMNDSTAYDYYSQENFASLDIQTQLQELINAALSGQQQDPYQFNPMMLHQNMPMPVPWVNPVMPPLLLPQTVNNRQVFNTQFYVPDPLDEEFFKLLQTEMETFSKEMQHSLESVHCEREQAIRIIEKTVQETQSSKYNPYVGIRKYGSMASGLAIDSSDVDLAVTGFSFNNDQQKHINHLRDLYDRLSLLTCKHEISKFETATVPLIKLKINLQKIRNKLSRRLKNNGDSSAALDREKIVGRMQFLSIDITIEDHSQLSTGDFSGQPSKINLGIQCISFIKSLCEEFKDMRPIILVLKKLLAKHSLNSPYGGGLCSYSLVLMVSAFLRKNNAYSTPKNLCEFLNFFGNYFDPSTTGIQNQQIYQLSQTNHSENMIVIDPLNYMNNTTRNAFRIDDIQSLFSRAHRIIMSKLQGYKVLSQHGSSESASSIMILEALLEAVEDESSKKRLVAKEECSHEVTRA